MLTRETITVLCVLATSGAVGLSAQSVVHFHRLLHKAFDSNANDKPLLDPLRGFAKVGGTTAEFSLALYSDKFVAANGVPVSPASIVEAIEVLTDHWVGDIRNFFNYHDFVLVLLGALKAEQGTKLDSDQFADAFRLLYSANALASFNLFALIRDLLDAEGIDTETEDPPEERDENH